MGVMWQGACVHVTAARGVEDAFMHTLGIVLHVLYLHMQFTACSSSCILLLCCSCIVLITSTPLCKASTCPIHQTLFK